MRKEGKRKIMHFQLLQFAKSELPWWSSEVGHLPMLGTWVQSLLREDSTCLGQPGPCATTTEPMHPQAHALQQEKLPQ